MLAHFKPDYSLLVFGRHILFHFMLICVFTWRSHSLPAYYWLCLTYLFIQLFLIYLTALSLSCDVTFRMIRSVVNESGLGSVWGIDQECAWSNWGSPLIASVGTGGYSAEIRIEYLPIKTLWVEQICCVVWSDCDVIHCSAYLNITMT